MTPIESFPPELSGQPSALVLGSIPGVASLEAVQYYAHPRNAFWPIMAGFFEFDVALPYEQRLTIVKQNGLALWDVLGRCRRPGSLDSAIVADSIEANAIDQLVAQQPSIQHIFLNGGKAASEFKKHFPSLINSENVTVHALPSTSPAYAAMPLAEKKRRWHAALVQAF